MTPGEINTDQITREAAQHVLSYFGHGGYPPGGFTASLITTISKADPRNRALLARAFPAYTTAVSLAIDITGGLDTLALIAAGEHA